MQKVLIIGFVWPEPTTTAAGVRIMQLMQYFLEQNYSVTFASTAAKSQFSVNLDSLGIKEEEIVLNSNSFDDFIKILNPDIVLFDRFLTEEQFGWRVVEKVPSAIRILDTEDLHFLRKAREDAHKRQNVVTESDLLNSAAAKREIASIYRCDLSLIISSYEIDLLTRVFKIDKSLLLYLPFMLDKITAETTENWLSFEDRSNFVCIGNGKHTPNIDAIKWLKQEIWPNIKKALPETELQIYGAYLPSQVTQLHNNKDGFLVKGWATDVTKVLENARINLAPLRFGAGIKGKLIGAMQNGTPSVTTTIGAEGMHLDLPWAGVVAETASDIVAAAIAIYQNKNDWKKSQNNGVSIISTIYSKVDIMIRINLKIKHIEDNLVTHRNENFIGAMLQHHTMNSTKYLSKYIEEKNK